MLMSEKVLGLSPPSPSPSSSTSIPATSSSKINSSLESSTVPALARNSFNVYSSPSSREKVSSSSTLPAAFFNSSSSQINETPSSSTLLNTWTSKPLGSHNFRNSSTTSHVNNNNSSSPSSGSISTSSSFDTLITAKTNSSSGKSSLTLSEEKSCDSINKSKRKREEWTQLNDNDDNINVRRYIKVHNRKTKRLLREQKDKTCVVKIGQKIETQLPNSELVNLRVNKCVNLVNLEETVSPLNRKLSSIFSAPSKGNNSDSHTLHSPPRQIISNSSGSKRANAEEIIEDIDLAGESSSKNYSDCGDHSNDDENHSSSRKNKPYRYIGPKSRRERRDQINRDINHLEREMTAEDKYDALVGNPPIPNPKTIGDVNTTHFSGSTAQNQTYQKHGKGKDVLSQRLSDSHGEQSSFDYREKEMPSREVDYFSDKDKDAKNQSYRPKVSETRTSSAGSFLTSTSETNYKLAGLKEKLENRISPLKINNLSSLKQSSNPWGSQSHSKSLEQSIEKLKFPNSKDNSNSCSTRPENPPSSTISSSHLTSPALAAAAAIATPTVANICLPSAISSYTSAFHTNKSTLGLSSLFSDSKLQSLSSPTSPKSSSPTNSLPTTEVALDDSMMANDGGQQQPRIEAAYSLKSFEDAPEGENLRDDNDWSLQPISPPIRNSIEDSSFSRTSLHKRFFPQKYEGRNSSVTDSDTESNNQYLNKLNGVEKHGNN